MKLHVRHGWGYDARFWAPLMDRLTDAFADDRGYFGPPRADPIAAGEPHVLIGHSFGTMRMLAETGPSCRGLVAINGFDRFVGGNDFPGVAPRMLARMIDRCALDPHATLVAFRARCGDFRPPPAGTTDRLLSDLRRLQDGSVPHPSGLPLLRLDGAADPLLYPAHRAACFAGAPALEQPGGGHLLPVTHTDWCAAAITDFMAQLS